MEEISFIIWYTTKMNETVELIRGLKYRKNNNGYAVLELKYTADPDKDPERNGAEWYKNAKEGMSSDEWEQEYEINYQIKIGKRVFPDFTEKSICKLIYNPHKPLLIGWDFGLGRRQFCSLNGMMKIGCVF